MPKEKNPQPRKLMVTVTNFLHCGDDYLFVLRDANKSVDAGRLNGIGGKVEPGENFLQAAIRETEEETGYVVRPDQVQLAAVARLEGGYPQDWGMCFFKMAVPSKEIPMGNDTPEGKLIWLHKDEVLTSGYELVDDLNYCFPAIAEGGKILFFHAQANEHEKIETINLDELRI
jgi:8-oxo-dGTP pyrophosphatase MutT (NUDIX family)